MTDRIRVDMQDLTLRELSELHGLLGVEGAAPMAELMGGAKQFEAMAAMAYLTRRRDDPTFTYEQALDLKMGDLELVAPDPEVPGADNGAMPQPSPESGASIPSA